MQPERRARLRRGASEVLAGNWREGRRRGVPYAFTRPGAPRYLHQWYWDSCFHAIANRHLDPARARAELRTLLRAGDGDGLIPHTIFWDARPRWRRAPLYATRRPRGDVATASIQTPMLALAWEQVAAASAEDDPRFATESLDELRRHYDWLERERDIDGDGLIAIVLPDESGLDDSPKYDPLYGWMAHHRPGYFWLVERSRRLGYRLDEIAARHGEYVEDVLVNVLYALSLHALSRLLGEDHSGAYETRARRVEQALLERCLDPATGLFLDLAGPHERPLAISTWSSLAPLALTALPEDVRRRLVEDHLLDPRRYRAPTGIPSVSMEEPSFRPGFDLWRCWRGPSWMNTAWLLVPALDELGYHDESERIVDSLADAVERHGFREYYNPLSGAGLGTRNFGFATLLVDLLERSSLTAASG